MKGGWHLEEYTNYMKTRYTASTVMGYRRLLEEFRRWAERRGLDGVTDLTENLIEEYRGYVINLKTFEGKPLAVRTINIHLTSLALYSRWLKRNGHIAHDITEELEYLKGPKKLPGLVLSDSEIRKLLASCDLHETCGYRDRAILELLYSSAVRRMELLNLDTDDLDLEGGLAKIRQGKGQKDRIVPVGRTAVLYLENYLKGIRPILINRRLAPDRDEERALFINAIGKRLGRMGLAHLVRKAAKRAAIHKPVTPHVFRRSCATGMIRNKANPYYVKELLGHERLDSLEPYLKLTITDLKEVHRKCHPRERNEPGH